jgi:predicted kinase
MEIGAALDFTKSFAQDFGIKPASMQSVRLMQASSPKPRDEFFDYYGKPNRTLNYEYGDPNRPLGVLDYGSKESDQRQVRGLDFAAIPLTRMVAEALAAFEYNPDQARVPKGDPDGGQFTKDGGGGGAEATSDLKTEGHLAQFDAAGRALPPPTNPRARGREVEKLTDDLMAAGLDTQTLHDTVDGQLGHYTTEREALHHEIIDEIMQDADNRGVPRDYEAVMLGGLPAAGKSSAVAEMLDTDKYIVINPDLMKEALAERHAYETPAGMGRMEGSSLVHEESSTLAKALAQEAISQGYNVAFDMTMQNEKAFTSRADMLDKYGGGQYKLTGIFVDVPIQQSLDMAAKRYGDELKTMPDMARHVPTSFITDSVDHSGRWDSTNEATFESVKDRMDGFLKIDNTNFKKEIVDSSPGALDLLRRK